MVTIPVILTVLLSLVALVWASRHVQLSHEKHTRFVLAPESPGPPANAVRISVIVAAKDEAENIEACVRTVLRQDYPDFELIVCDDRSTDQTGAIVERIAAEDARVRLINVEILPEGWCGKNHAMQKAIAQSSGEWICMIDADCRQISNRTLSTAMQHAVDNRIDLLSVLPTLDMQGFWETAVQPVGSGTMMIWFSPADVNNPGKKQAYANGAFMLMRRSAYEAVGTHEAVRDRLSEDMNIAALVKRSGLKLKVVRSSRLYQVRMYSSLKEMVRGWSRIFFGTFGTVGRLLVSLMVLSMVGMAPWVLVPVAFALSAASEGAAGWWLVCGFMGAVALAAQITVLFRFYRICNLNGWMAWTYPIGNMVTTCAVIFALTRHLPNAKVVWKNTEYSRP